MNISTALAFLSACGIFLHSVLTSTDNRSIFLNEHGILIVLGGTLTAGAISFPIKKIIVLGGVAFKKMLFGYHIDYRQEIRNIITLGEKSRTDLNAIKTEIGASKNPFLAESLQLLVDGFTEDQMREILEARIETFSQRYSIEANIFKNLSKFPPAFGLFGTTLGMIALLQKIGGEDATKQIGPAMAVGLIATLYGIALTNFIFLPIAENLTEKSREDTILRRIILEGVIMLKNKTHPLLIAEKLNSYLLPDERISLRGEETGKSKGKKAA